jgi:hypothetical protein
MANNGVLSKLQVHHAASSRLIRDIHERIDEGDANYGSLYQSLKRELLSHSTAEDEVVFAALAKHAACVDDVRDGRDEHEEIHELLRSLDCAEDEDEWLATFEELSGVVEHHIREVEHDTFALAERVLGPESLVTLARDYQRERRTVHEGPEREVEGAEASPDTDELEDDEDEEPEEREPAND